LKQPDGSSSHLARVDMTRSGVRFEVKEELKIGEIIELTIIIPHKENIQIKGNVVWTSKAITNSPATLLYSFFLLDQMSGIIQCIVINN